MTEELKHHHIGSTLVLTIANAESGNALGPAIYHRGLAILEQFADAPQVRSVVITGEGDKFSVGGNLNRLLANRQKAPEVQSQSIDLLHAWVARIHAFPKPVIAAVEGAAAGAGFSLALACDFIVAASDAVFVMAYSKVGLSPDGGGSWALSQSLPRHKANEILMLGDRLSSTQLQELGLVNRIAAPGEALNEALVLADRLNARAPNATQSIKALVRQGMGHRLDQQLAMERDHFVANLHHANAGIAIQAFLERKTPDFPAVP